MLSSGSGNFTGGSIGRPGGADGTGGRAIRREDISVGEMALCVGERMSGGFVRTRARGWRGEVSGCRV